MATGRIEARLESSDFSCEAIQIGEISGRERISTLFDFEIRFSTPVGAGLDPSVVMGATASLVLLQEGVEKRRIHGMVASITDLLGSETDVDSYRLRFVPRAFRLTMIKTQETFLALSIPQIIEQKLGLVGLEDAFEVRVDRQDPLRDFVVQYDETDLAFLSRLTEHAGISFYFDHSGDADRIVFTDHPAGFQTIAGADEIAFRERGDKTDVYRLEATRQLVPSMYAVADYNPETPQLDLTSVFELEGGYAGGIIEFGAHFRTPDEGKALARVRAEEHADKLLVFEGEADLCTLEAGSRVTLRGHPRLDDIELLIVDVAHHLTQVEFGSGSATQPKYSATFKAIRAAVPYRPPRVTPRPRIAGLMSGIVEAAPGIETERPWIDEHGRYLVRLLFDTAAPGERKASVPIRMAQAHSGPGYGIHFPLRPGIEVLLAFVGGDPDRPIIVGSVPNAVTPTPVVDREANMHRIKTWSGVLVEIDDG